MGRVPLLCVALAGCAHANAILFTGGNVWTGDPARPSAHAVLVQDGRITAVGDDAEVAAAAPGGARRIRLRGRVLLPGFEDAHIHILGGGLGLDRLELSSAKTKQEILSAIAAYAKAHPERPWILGRGWSYDAFKPALPTAADLDRVMPDRPVFLEAYDGHSAWVNSKALAAAGITAATPNPQDGEIVRLPGGRQPSGTLLEEAMSLVGDKAPKASAEEKKAAIEKALRLAASLGVTAAGEVGGELADLAIYEELDHRGHLPIRVSYGPAVSGAGDGAAEYAPSYKRLRERRGLLTGGPQKSFVDGVIESNTAQLLQPYADGSGHGATPHLDVSVMQGQIVAARKVGLDLAWHAVGDGAVRAVLDALEKEKATSAGTRCRVEHIEVVDPADVPRFKDLGVIASMMPIHADPSAETGQEVGVWSKKVGVERLKLAFALRTLADAGARLAFGSDWPVAPIDPLRALAIAVTRQDDEGKPASGWVPEQRLDLPRALAAYTTGSAYAMRLDDRAGMIQVGLAADLVVLDRGVDLTRPGTLRTGKVDFTLVNGRVVYARP